MLGGAAKAGVDSAVPWDLVEQWHIVLWMVLLLRGRRDKRE